MKKILTVSVLAMMAVTAANAEIASRGYVDQQTGTLSNLQTTAKTNLVGAINELVSNTSGENGLTSRVGALETGKADKATVEAGTHTKITYNAQGIVTGGADLTATDIPELTLSKISDAGTLAGLSAVGSEQITDGSVALGDLATGVQTSLGKADSALQAADIADKADAAENLTGATKTKITYNNQGIVTAGADLEASDIPTLTLSKISDAGTLAGLSAVGSEQITDGSVALGDLATGVQTSLGKADSALQSGDVAQTYDASGTAPVSGAAVASAISTAAGNYATSAQGQLADSAVQSVAEGATNGTIAVDGTDVAVHGLDALAYKDSVGTNDIDDASVTIAKLSAGLPADCQASGSYDCVLKSASGVLGWEKITRATGEPRNGGSN